MTGPKLIVEVVLAAIATVVAGLIGFSQFIYPRSEAERLESRVDNIEQRIDHRLERIETFLYRGK